MAIHPALIRPSSIVVVGGTDNLQAPGGRLLKNLLDHHFEGRLYVVNPKKNRVQGLTAYPDVKDLPEQVDLAIIAIPARFVEEVVRILAREKGTRGFIIISAGFADTGPEGKALEERIVAEVERVGGSLLGPNNIGLINTHYAGVFTTPVPRLDPNGVDLISGSGATAVFIMEAAMPLGLRFNSVWTVGNAAQIGVEDVLEHLDATYTDARGRTLMIYAETVKHPKKWLRHARSLVEKGARIVAVKAGSSQAGSRAASSHTGAMATPDAAVDALFAKAGILRAHGRLDMIYRAGVFRFPQPASRRMIVVTHAGGPAVMLTDVLEKNGFRVPEINHPKARELENEVLFPGASVKNPIDILATGTAEQLDKVLAYSLEYFAPGAISVIFGSPGLFPVDKAYDVIDRYIRKSPVPVYPVMPSLINTAREMENFRRKGHFHFTDEVMFGRALGDVSRRPPLFPLPGQKDENLRKQLLNLIEGHSGYLEPGRVRDLLQTAGLPVVEQILVSQIEDLDGIADDFFPMVMKVVGPVHKTESGGVRLNVTSPDEARQHFNELMQIPKAKAVLIQPLIHSPLEMYAGLKKNAKFGHLLLFGQGGTDLEIRKDVQKTLVPAGIEELNFYLKRLSVYPLLKGYRGQKGIDIPAWINLLEKLSVLAVNLPEIEEMDLNPVLFVKTKPVIVDARIRIR